MNNKYSAVSDSRVTFWQRVSEFASDNVEAVKLAQLAEAVL